MELLDGSVGASGSSSCERPASETSQGADADAARVRALAAYKDFLTLWKDADPDIPIFIAAKSEYAKLQLLDWGFDPGGESPPYFVIAGCSPQRRHDSHAGFAAS